MHEEKQARCWAYLGATPDIRHSAGWLAPALCIGTHWDVVASRGLLRLSMEAAAREAQEKPLTARHRAEEMYWRSIADAYCGP